MATVREHKRLLRDLLRFLKALEDCKCCVEPEASFDGKHLVEWRQLKERIEKLARDPDSEKAPN